MRIRYFSPLCWAGIAVAGLLFSSVAQTASEKNPQAQRGVKPAGTPARSVEGRLYQESYALIIGMSKYENEKAWRNLQGVAEDLPKVKAALEKHGFKVTCEENLNGAAFREKIKTFILEKGAGFKNRILIYFAGHGATHRREDGLRDGYLIPSDTPSFEENSVGFKDRAVSMFELEKYAYMIESKHALFVFDSCFSGSLFEVMRSSSGIATAAKRPPLISKMVASPVRQFITSGTEDQQVADNSFFCQEFIRGLEGAADLNHDGYVTGSELGMHLENKVTNYYNGSQTPRYGKIRDRRLDKGDFVFSLKTRIAKSSDPENISEPENNSPSAPSEVSATRSLVPNANAELFYETGIDAMRRGSYFKANEALKEAIKQDPEFPLAYAQRAEALLELDYQDQAKNLLLMIDGLPGKARLSTSQQLYLQAMSAVARRDYQSAIDNYLKLDSLAAQNDKSYIQFDLGRAYEKNEQIDLAIACYQQTVKDPRTKAAAWLRLGILYGRKQLDTESQQAFEQALNIYRPLGNEEGQAEVFYHRGYIANNRGRYAEARAAFNQALKLVTPGGNELDESPAKILGYKSLRALSILQLASIYLVDGRLTQAKNSITKIRRLTEAEGMQEIYLRALVDLGNIFLAAEKYQEAEDYYQQAYSLAESRNAQRNLARARFHLGSVHFQQGKIDDEVLTEVTRAMEFYAKGGYRRELTATMILLARIEGKRRNYDGALKAFREQVEFAEKSNDKNLQAEAREGIAAILTEQEQYPQAISEYQVCLDINLELNDQRAIVYDLLNLGTLYWKIGKNNGAENSLNTFDKLSKFKIDEYAGIVTALRLSRAEMKLSQRDYAGARDELSGLSLDPNEKGKAAIDQTDSETILDFYRLSALSEGLNPTGDQNKARDYLRQALKMGDDIKNPILTAGLLIAQSEIELKAGNFDQTLAAILAAQKLLSEDRKATYPDSLYRCYQIALICHQALQHPSETETYRKLLKETEAQLTNYWGTYFSTYQSRPDVQQYLQRLRP